MGGKRNIIEIVVGSPFNQQPNGLAEKLIRDLKMFISIYQDHPRGWKVCLEVAEKHRNHSFCSTIGCSPQFALNGQTTYLPTDERLRIQGRIRLTEGGISVEEENRRRKKQRKHFDKRHATKVLGVSTGDLVLVWKGNQKQFYETIGLYRVVDVETISGPPKRVRYEVQGATKVAALRNVLKFCPRRDSSFRGGK